MVRGFSAAKETHPTWFMLRTCMIPHIVDNKTGEKYPKLHIFQKHFLTDNIILKG